MFGTLTSIVASIFDYM
ncbi:hypothetical protein F383_16017 [Gossypium arboreum]|uniref:Uncharacterized protein n=1 Tax=Gossypium arboreum TaxID=29729 RepID=A0A0B0PXA6_GOSAR|nr:hypothetical protein F383_16017 [Gossypium arboreum]